MANEKWSEWEPLGGGPMWTNMADSMGDNPQPTISSWGPKRLDIFVGTDGENLRHKFWHGKWSDWEELDAYVSSTHGTGSPSAVSWGLDRIDIFANNWQTPFSRCYQLTWNGSAGWNEWRSPPHLWENTPSFAERCDSPAVCARGVNVLDLFIVAHERGEPVKEYPSLLHFQWDGISWYGSIGDEEEAGSREAAKIRYPENLGGELTSSPAAVSWDPHRIDVVARGPDGNIWHTYWNYGSDWAPWYCPNNQLVLSNRGTNAPAICSWAPGRLDLFATSNSRRLQHMYWDNAAGAWSGWEDLGGELTSSPAAVSWGPNRIDVVAFGKDNNLWHKYWG